MIRKKTPTYTASIHFVFWLIVFSITTTHFAQGQNIEREIEKGEEAKLMLEQQIGFYDHSSSEFLNDIGQRLVSNIYERLFDYQFGILDMTEPNAVALPGGYVYFSRGLLALANSEDELGGVMGHEIIHVHKLHSRKAKNNSIFTGILKAPGAIVGVFAPTAGGILMAPFSMLDASYSRKHEKQADELGVQLAAKTGYDPQGLVTILDKIAEDAELQTGKEEQRSFFSTHPYTPKRIDDLNKTVLKLDYPTIDHLTSNHKAFIEKLSGLVIGNNPANGVFLDSLFLHPKLQFTFRYPKGWEGINLPQVVGIISPDNDAQLAFSLDDTIKSATQLAKEFKQNYYNYYRTVPVRNESLDIHSYNAHILSYEGSSDEEAVVLSLLWLKRDKYMFRIAMLSTYNYKDIILDLAKSIHHITDEERLLIKQTILHIVEAKEGESLKEFNARTGNVLDLKYTALINNLKTDARLAKGQWLKIGLLQNY